MDYIIEENELKTIINKVNQNIIESKNYQNNFKSVTSNFSSSYKTNNTSKIEKVANVLNNNLVNINNNCSNNVKILNKVVSNYMIAANVSNNFLSNIITLVGSEVSKNSKNGNKKDFVAETSNKKGNVVSEINKKIIQTKNDVKERNKAIKDGIDMDLNNGGLISNVIGNVQRAAKNESIVNQATNVINDKISLVKNVINIEAAAGYNASSYAEIKNGIIIGKNKSGENSRLYLHNSDGSLKGIINLDTNEAIKNIKYDSGNNQIIVKTINGDQKVYDINRLERSIELANIENDNIAKYYATDDAYYAEKGTRVVDKAKSAMGVLYDWGGVGEEGRGYDCSGLVSYALTGEHVRLGTTHTFMGWPKADNPQPGDVVTTSSHCGIYIGKDENGVPLMVHAPDFGQPVQISPVQSDMIYVKYPG